MIPGFTNSPSCRAGVGEKILAFCGWALNEVVANATASSTVSGDFRPMIAGKNGISIGSRTVAKASSVVVLPQALRSFERIAFIRARIFIVNFITSFGAKMRYLILALLAISCFAATPVCSSYNSATVVVQGTTFQAAIVNGVQATNIVPGAMVFQWTSDAATTAISQNYAIWVTDATWVSNGNSFGSTPNQTLPVQFGGGGLTIAGAIQGATITNLPLTPTVIHIAGISTTSTGPASCPSSQTVTTFTTLAADNAKPIPPVAVTNVSSEPTITGTDRTVGVTTGCTGGTLDAAFRACIAISNPGDGIGIVPGTPIDLLSPVTTWKVPPSAVAVSSITGSTFNATAHGFTNGQQVHLSSTFNIPSPTNPGVTYSIINVTTNTFQISQDGSTALTLNDGGIGQVYVFPFPLSQSYVIIHSTAAASVLPPFGVRLDPVAYGANLGTIRITSPLVSPDFFEFQSGSSYYWFENIHFQMLPAMTAAQVDTDYYLRMMQVESYSDHIVFDRVWVDIVQPARLAVFAEGWSGTNMAIMDSYLDGLEFWKYSMIPNGTAPTVGTNSVTLNPVTVTWPNYLGAIDTCSISSAITPTFTGGTSGGLDFKVYLQHDPCIVTVAADSGLSVSGSGFTTVPTTGSPAWPVDGTGHYTAIQIAQGTVNTSSITGFTSYYTDNGTCNGCPSEGGGTIVLMLQGPYLFQNNFLQGAGIIGLFNDENSANACAGVTRCDSIQNTVNITVKRNTMQADERYDPLSASWNGAYGNWRNCMELKQGAQVLLDGNIIGPCYASLGGGQCFLWETYYGNLANNGTTPNPQLTGDIEIKNNTMRCANGIQGGGLGSGYYNPNVSRRGYIHDNILMANSYARSVNPNTGQGAAFLGTNMGLSGVSDLIIEHNTIWQAGGPFPPSFAHTYQLLSGWDISNNLFQLVGDSGSAWSGLNYSDGALGVVPVPDPTLTTPNVFLPFIPQFQFLNNVFLGTCTNSTPSTPYCTTEMNNTTINSYAAGYSNYPTNLFPTTGTTLSNRVAGVHWYDPANLNFRLNYLSPYISGGASHASDGLDVGANINALEAAQGVVSGVHVSALGTTTASVTWLAPDATSCTFDYGTANFPSGSGSWTRVNPTATGPGGPRVQTASLTGLTTGTNYTYRVNCQVMQPTGTFVTH